MKLLVLAIASDSPVYRYFTRVFKAYMNKRPWMKSYLLYGNSNRFYVTEDEIHMPVKESLIPGILHKTLWAMKWAVDNIEFDYLLRTNLSSFWLLDHLEEYLNTIPKKNVCFSHRIAIDYLCPGDPGMLDGSGMFYSRDIIERITKIDDWNYDYPDDSEFSRKVFIKCRPQILDKKYYKWNCQNIDNINIEENIQEIEKDNYIQVRIKNPSNQGVDIVENDRLLLDPVIQAALYYRYEALIPVLSKTERDLARLACLFHVSIDTNISEELKIFLKESPFCHEMINQLKITNNVSEKGLCIQDGYILINTEHKLIGSLIKNDIIGHVSL